MGLDDPVLLAVNEEGIYYLVTMYFKLFKYAIEIAFLSNIFFNF